MTRANRNLARRRDYHLARIAQAETPGRALAAACQWLVSEASKAGPEFVNAANLMVRAQIDAIAAEVRETQTTPSRGGKR